jgi:hypothetical protein
MEIDNDQKPIYEWQELDQAIRRWVVTSNFERDLEKYNELKQETEDNILRGYN